MEICEVKTFRIWVEKEEDVEKARQRLEDKGYKVLELKEIKNKSFIKVYEAKVKLPWRRIL